MSAMFTKNVHKHCLHNFCGSDYITCLFMTIPMYNLTHWRKEAPKSYMTIQDLVNQMNVKIGQSGVYAPSAPALFSFG